MLLENESLCCLTIGDLGGFTNYSKKYADKEVYGGEFNDIYRYFGRKEGGEPSSIRKCNLFADRFNSCHLMDIGVVGSKYTWRTRF